ncbi:peptidase [Streptomyces sp. AcH 505]|uniref:S8 family peptidase n=1 Tax=Streptomyces sp. AcH 505 TaxID=352211 RepID=UPI000591D209|nr:peptidase [Streptomyces sp. AcH 505]
MRLISRTALGAAAAAVLAVTAVAPSVATPRAGVSDGTGKGSGTGKSAETGKRPVVGSAAAQRKSGQSHTVTLVTGDKVRVSEDSSGRGSATVLPREDGTQPLVQTRQSGDDLYVYPEGAAAAIAFGRVDDELFNVTGLIRQGYDDAHATSIPLIATYDTPAGSVARELPVTPRGARRGAVLDAIGGVALKADKTKAADFWADVTSPRNRAASQLKKVWLDGQVTSLMDQSAKQVNAPQAWAAGYDGKGTKVAVLDTGADLEHPDLQGRVAATENFTDSDTVEDRQGHGTHTASTVGGSGAASDGKEKGVAPGTDLMIGKVLNDSGSGLESWIIAGMQWAVDQKADVVSMSLGDPGLLDCTDPMSQATEELAHSKDTLFVIAAGNAGPGDNTVSSPGCAPSVLTVGAVDSADATASFSSRGPVLDAHTLKPEIAAPGVDILAANMGGRGVYAYQTMSGTSMATPHVAGAAAILKERHPDWSAQQLKAALVSSARTDIPGDVRETGGGRLDVEAAIGQSVVGAPAIQGGSFNWPQDKSDRTSVDVPYTNFTGKPLKLNLSVGRVTGNDGTTVRSAVAKLGKSSVTVPAGATVKVPLAVDPVARLANGQYGDVTGRVLATGAGGVSVSTPFALYVQPTTVTLRVKLVDRTGKPAAGSSSLDVIGTDTATGESRFNEGATDQVFQLRPGAYFLSSFVVSPDTTDATGQQVGSVSYLGRPQVDLKRDTTLVLDARKAHRISVRTDRPSEVRTTTLNFARSWDNQWLHAGSVSGGRLVKDYYADVQDPAEDGEFEFGSYWRAYAPQFQKLTAVGGPELHPVTASVGSDNLDGTGEAQLVDAGKGTPAELTAAGVRGKIALVEVPDDGALGDVGTDALAAGAKAVVMHRPSAGRWQPAYGFAGGPLPTVAVEAAEAKALEAKLAAGQVTLRWKATATSPYVYNLGFPEDGTIGSDRTYHVRDGQLGRNDSTYNSMGVAADFIDGVGAYRPSGSGLISVSGIDLVAMPSTRAEYYTGDGTTWDHFVSSSFPFGEYMMSPARAYQPGKKVKESWYDGVIGPNAGVDATGAPALAAERQGNQIGFAPAMWSDTEHTAQPGSFGDIGSLLLRRNGEDFDSSGFPYGVFTVPADDAEYELISNNTKIGSSSASWQRSTDVVTDWTFRSHLDDSAFSQGIPLLFPRYDLPADGAKTLPAKDGLRIGLSVTGHAGYTPGAVVSAALSYSYDGGKTWTAAEVDRRKGAWTATVNHAGADSAAKVTLRTTLADANGNKVTQTVTDAYGLR